MLTVVFVEIDGAVVFNLKFNDIDEAFNSQLNIIITI